MTLLDILDEIKRLSDVEVAAVEVGARAEAQRRTLNRWKDNHPPLWRRILRSVR